MAYIHFSNGDEIEVNEDIVELEKRFQEEKRQFLILTRIRTIVDPGKHTKERKLSNISVNKNLILYFYD